MSRESVSSGKIPHEYLLAQSATENLEEVLSKFKTVIFPEMNDGQLVNLIRAKYLLDIKPVNKMNGVPFTTAEIESAALKAMEAS